MTTSYNNLIIIQTNVLPLCAMNYCDIVMPSLVSLLLILVKEFYIPILRISSPEPLEHGAITSIAEMGGLTGIRAYADPGVAVGLKFYRGKWSGSRSSC